MCWIIVRFDSFSVEYSPSLNSEMIWWIRMKAGRQREPAQRGAYSDRNDRSGCVGRRRWRHPRDCSPKWSFYNKYHLWLPFLNIYHYFERPGYLDLLYFCFLSFWSFSSDWRHDCGQTGGNGSSSEGSCCHFGEPESGGPTVLQQYDAN